MLVQGRALQFGDIECDRRSIIGCLSQQVVPCQMIAGEVYEFLGRRIRRVTEDLTVDMIAQLLDADLVEAGFGGDCASC